MELMTVSGAVNATLTCYFSQILLNVILPPTLGIFECFLAFMYCNEKYVSFLTSPMGGVYDSPTLSYLLLFIFDYVESNERIIHGRWIWKDLQGRWCNLVEVLSGNLLIGEQIAKHLNQDTRFPSRVSNPRPKSQSYTSLLGPIFLHSSTNNIYKDANYRVTQVTVLHS